MNYLPNVKSGFLTCDSCVSQLLSIVYDINLHLTAIPQKMLGVYPRPLIKFSMRVIYISTKYVCFKRRSVKSSL